MRNLLEGQLSVGFLNLLLVCIMGYAKCLPGIQAVAADRPCNLFDVRTPCVSTASERAVSVKGETAVQAVL